MGEDEEEEGREPGEHARWVDSGDDLEERLLMMRWLLIGWGRPWLATTDYRAVAVAALGQAVGRRRKMRRQAGVDVDACRWRQIPFWQTAIEALSRGSGWEIVIMA